MQIASSAEFEMQLNLQIFVILQYLRAFGLVGTVRIFAVHLSWSQHVSTSQAVDFTPQAASFLKPCAVCVRSESGTLHVFPPPATHSILTALKVGVIVYQADNVPKTL